MGMRLKVHANTSQKQSDLEWIPSHRDESQVTGAVERAHICRTNEVDIFAKMATPLPVPIAWVAKIHGTGPRTWR